MPELNEEAIQDLNQRWAEAEMRGDIAALKESIETWHLVLQQRPRDRVPLDWAMTQNNLGNAPERLGERESGTTHLTEAVAAYRAALEEQPRKRVPLDWATVQNNLGDALTTCSRLEASGWRRRRSSAVSRPILRSWSALSSPRNAMD